MTQVWYLIGAGLSAAAGQVVLRLLIATHLLKIFPSLLTHLLSLPRYLALSYLGIARLLCSAWLYDYHCI